MPLWLTRSPWQQNLAVGCTHALCNTCYASGFMAIHFSCFVSCVSTFILYLYIFLVTHGNPGFCAQNHKRQQVSWWRARYICFWHFTHASLARKKVTKSSLMIQISEKFVAWKQARERAWNSMENATGTNFSNFVTKRIINPWFRTATFASNLVCLWRQNNIYLGLYSPFDRGTLLYKLISCLHSNDGIELWILGWCE